MRVDRGYLIVGTYKSAPIRVHWSMPVGAFVLTGCSFVPGAWIGFFLLVLIHELGHAFLVRRFRLHVESIDVHGLGGACRWSGPASRRQRAAIAWGGVLAQAALLALALPFAWLLRGFPIPLFGDLLTALIVTNLFVMFINLLPIRPLDGAEAWSFFSRVNVAEAKREAARRKQQDIQKRIDDLQGEEDDIDPLADPAIREVLEKMKRKL